MKPQKFPARLMFFSLVVSLYSCSAKIEAEGTGRADDKAGTNDPIADDGSTISNESNNDLPPSVSIASDVKKTLGSGSDFLELYGNCQPENAEIVVTIEAVSGTTKCIKGSWKITLDVSSITDSEPEVSVSIANGVKTEKPIAILIDRVPPQPAVINLISDIDDGTFEHALAATTKVLATVTTSIPGDGTTTHALTSSATACDIVKHYKTEIPTSKDPLLLPGGTYKICAKTKDKAGNAVFAESKFFNYPVTTGKVITVSAGADQLVNSVATVSGTTSETGTYTWTKKSGPGTVTFGTGMALSTTVSADTDGTYVLRLTVVDGDGNSGFDEMNLIWDQTVPTVSAGSNRSSGSMFTQTGTSNETGTYLWSKQSGPGTITFGSGNALSTTVSADTIGTYVLRLTVADAAGNSGFGEMSLTWSTSASPVPADLTIDNNDQRNLLNWKSGGGTTAGYLLIVRSSAPVDWVPTNGVSYAPGPVGAGNTVIYSGAATSHADTGLDNGTSYHYALYSRTGSDDYSSAKLTIQGTPLLSVGMWTFTRGYSLTPIVHGNGGTIGVTNPSNIIHARQKAASWFDGTNSWIFGGAGYGPTAGLNTFNDLWKWDGTSWTWLKGTTVPNIYNTYGTQGVAAPTNILGSRSGSATAREPGGTVWIFGGNGMSQSGGPVKINDLWKWDGSDWTYVMGPKTLEDKGTYGTKGIPDAANVPSARQDASAWVDASGNFWVFGGRGCKPTDCNNTVLNDLWKWDGAEWTWISGDNAGNNNGVYGTKGTSDPSNQPGGREQASVVVDGAGNFWMFGGYGFASTGSKTILNDLWKFDGTNWTWVSGPDTGGGSGVYGTLGVSDAANIPTPRYGHASWIEGTNFWIFAGNTLNDLWKFDGTEWTWMSGSSTANAVGVYGTKNVASAANVPGGRMNMNQWKDDSGNILVFGGNGYDRKGGPFTLNDLWKWNGSQWTWISGGDIASDNGTYGTLGVSDAANQPGGRTTAASASDSIGNLWLFGGFSYDAIGKPYRSNLLMKYNGSVWTRLVGGSSSLTTGVESTPLYGTYNTKGVSAPTNYIGPREHPSMWVDAGGTPFVFGGTDNGNRPMSDLWKFDGTNWVWISGPSAFNLGGVYGTKGVTDPSNVIGARSKAGVASDPAGNIYLFGGTGCQVGNTCYKAMNDLWKWDGSNWTWLSGSDTGDQLGIYGTQGIGDPANTPGGRHTAKLVHDGTNLWLYGGYGNGISGGGYLSDLWKWDGAQWTWVSGLSSTSNNGVYGTKGVANSANRPGARQAGAFWRDSSGNFWVFGGLGMASSGQGKLNDLWKWDGTNWTWIAGTNLKDQPGVHGTLGVPDSANTPGGRLNSAVWTTKSGNLILYGGEGFDGQGWDGNLRDLWRFTP